MRLRAILVVLASLPLLAMGNLGLGGSGGAPERNYPATFVDRDGVSVEADWVNAGGELAFSGELGRGNVRVSFGDVDRVDFSGDGQEDLVAKVALRDGKIVDLRVRSSLAFYGQTEVGLYRIRARDLASIDFR